MSSWLNNPIIKWTIIIVVALAIIWLAGVVLEKLGAHFALGAGVGSSGFNFNLGGTK